MVYTFFCVKKLTLTQRTGLLRVEVGTVVYGRSMQGPVDADGYRTPDDDMFICADGDGLVTPLLFYLSAFFLAVSLDYFIHRSYYFLFAEKNITDNRVQESNVSRTHWTVPPFT